MDLRDDNDNDNDINDDNEVYESNIDDEFSPVDDDPLKSYEYYSTRQPTCNNYRITDVIDRSKHIYEVAPNPGFTIDDYEKTGNIPQIDDDVQGTLVIKSGELTSFIPETATQIFLNNRQNELGFTFPYILPIVATTTCSVEVHTGNNNVSEFKRFPSLVFFKADTNFQVFLNTYLKELLPSNRDIRFRFARSIVESIAFTHLNNFAHVDLKPENFFTYSIGPNLDDNYIVLADFGNSQIIVPHYNDNKYENGDKKTITKMKTQAPGTGMIITTSILNNWSSPNVVSPEFRPLEISCGAVQYSILKADIWALGLILVELFFDYKLFHEDFAEALESGDMEHAQNVIRRNIFEDLWSFDEFSQLELEYKDDDGKKYKKDEAKRCYDEARRHREKAINEHEFMQTVGEEPKIETETKLSVKDRDKMLKSQISQYKFENRKYKISKLIPTEKYHRAFKIYGHDKFDQILNGITKCLVLNPDERTGNIMSILAMPLFEMKEEELKNFVGYNSSKIVDHDQLPKEIRSFQWQKDPVSFLKIENLEQYIWDKMVLLSLILGARVQELAPQIFNDSDYEYELTMLAIFYLIYELFTISLEIFLTDSRYGHTTIDSRAYAISEMLGHDLWKFFFVPKFHVHTVKK